MLTARPAQAGLLELAELRLLVRMLSEREGLPVPPVDELLRVCRRAGKHAGDQVNAAELHGMLADLSLLPQALVNAAELHAQSPSASPGASRSASPPRFPMTPD